MSPAEPIQNEARNQSGKAQANGGAQDRRAPHIEALFQLSLSGERSAPMAHLAGLDAAGRGEFLRVAQAHHVVIRGLQPVYEHAATNGLADLAAWSEQGLAAERARVNNALEFLDRICSELESAGCRVVVI